MRRLLTLTLLATTLGLSAQTAPAADPLAPLDFLIGTWAAITDAPAGSSGASSAGNYSFHRDLNGHSLDRTGTADVCKGPQGFDCSHHATIFAFYQDNEGHIIYYTVSTPDPHTALFDSQGPPSAPKYRLIYHLEGAGPRAIMTGKFQMAAPGTDDFHSYLEWSGIKQ